MIKITLSLDGMQCSMCEAHVNDAVRAALSVRKVKSSHTRGETVVWTDSPPDERALRAALEKAGYRVLSVHMEQDTPCGLFSRLWK